MPEPLLAVENLVAGYGGAPVLRGVSLGVAEGEIVAVLGANGVGKTTLNRTLSGLVRASSGTIRFLGERIDRLAPPDIVRRGLIHVLENGTVVMQGPADRLATDPALATAYLGL
ncbi:ATP-binding cassette domain-containing protein [Elioraea thermophila]|uniref:ATP-binding cassette domain-containing protein n=1 Tax=Elioraea thermophila TaxID=2185104 RepID=UPI0018E55323|nr:ATP-binding cassette domain-containing protein [Elioraea thermophila]